LFHNHLRLKCSSLLNVYLNCKFEISLLTSYLFFNSFNLQNDGPYGCLGLPSMPTMICMILWKTLDDTKILRPSITYSQIPLTINSKETFFFFDSFLCMLLWDCSPYKKDLICGKAKHVSKSLKADTNTPEKCASFVSKECKYKDFFTWRKKNNACHCVDQPNCNSPKANKGLNIYRVSGCAGNEGIKSKWMNFIFLKSNYAHILHAKDSINWLKNCQKWKIAQFSKRSKIINLSSNRVINIEKKIPVDCLNPNPKIKKTHNVNVSEDDFFLTWVYLLAFSKKWQMHFFS